VGYLDGLNLTSSADPKRTVEFRIKVRRDYMEQIPVDSVVAISAANLLGDKFLNITKGQDTRHVEDGSELRSLEGQDIPELMAQSDRMLKSFQTILNRIDSLLAVVEAGKGNIGKLIKDEELYARLNGLVGEGQKLLSDVRTGPGTFGKLINDDSLYQEIRAPLRRIDAILADLQGGQGTAGRLLKDPALVDEANRLLTEIRGLVADINAGKGTAGKLLKDEELSRRLNDLTAKLNTTIDRINSGQGTLGQVMVNPQLYETLTSMTREFQSLARDIRANPKKFLSIRLTIF
jgi:phospholipid/cholesterol/gamma-HCH transport system substrate-binding protein